MHFAPNPADGEFRAQVRAFIARTLPELFPGKALDAVSLWTTNREYTRKWTIALNEQGWAVPYWPVEWGGAAWPPTWHSIFDDETLAASCPPTEIIGIGFVGPVLCAFGSDAQKDRFLPRIRRGDDLWCQGFSESGAGSDVMSLRTTAARQGQDLVINGQKLWVTNAHIADMMFALVRIDAPGNRRQQGLSFLLIDMRTPGITIRPIITIDGLHRVNEVTLDNVRVPAEALVGEQGKGWLYARFLLDKERSLVAQLSLLRRLVAALRTTLSTERRCGTPLIEEPACRLRLGQFEVELSALEMLELRFLHARDDDPMTQVLASMLKLRGSELRQRVSEAVWDACGDRGLEFASQVRAVEDAATASADQTHWSAVNYLYQRSATILGGTSEIQRNIIAGVSLGL